MGDDLNLALNILNIKDMVRHLKQKKVIIKVGAGQTTAQSSVTVNIEIIKK